MEGIKELRPEDVEVGDFYLGTMMGGPIVPCKVSKVEGWGFIMDGPVFGTVSCDEASSRGILLKEREGKLTLCLGKDILALLKKLKSQ